MNARSHILEVATRQMAARGADATSLAAIAKEVGIRKASILYHFPSKKALREAVMVELLTRWNEVLPRLFMATTRDGVARFDAVMGELVSFFVEDPDRARLLVREQMDRPEELNEHLEKTVRPWIDMIARTIVDGKKAGTIRLDVDPKAYVIAVLNLSLAASANIVHAGVLLGEDDDDAARKRCLHEVVRIARSALFIDPSED